MAVSKETLEKHLIQVRRIAEHREAKAEQNIRYYFGKLKKDLNSFLGNEYAKLAEDDKLTYAILQQKGEYARFLEEVISKVDGISPKLRAEVQSLIEETYKTCYKGLVKGVENIDDMAGLAKEFKAISAISPETVKRAVQNPIKKLTLNSTLERNRKQVISNIRREINIGLTQGDRMSTMANRISKHVEQDYRKSMLIARTEAHRVRESGFNDAAESVDTVLSENDSEFRMVKTWRNMRDGAVRHTDLANHVDMEGVTVLQDEDFELSDGSTAPCPGSSGVAAQDCNCRCYLARRIMNDEEYYRETGKHFSAKAFTNTEKRDIINTEAAMASSRYVNKNDRLYANAKNIKPIDGYEDIISHGDEFSLTFKDSNEKESNVSASEFVDILKKDPNYKGGNIRLISCNAGAGDGVVPQYVANSLGVDVMAPSHAVWVFPDGSMTIGDTPNDDNGEWKIFKPKKR